MIAATGPLREFVIPGDTVNKMFHDLFMHVVCNYRPDTTVSCPHLQKLFNRIGVKVFSADALRRTLLPKEVAKVQVSFPSPAGCVQLVLVLSKRGRSCVQCVRLITDAGAWIGLTLSLDSLAAHHWPSSS